MSYPKGVYKGNSEKTFIRFFILFSESHSCWVSLPDVNWLVQQDYDSPWEDERFYGREQKSLSRFWLPEEFVK